jgi:outer membrane protein TolC
LSRTKPRPTSPKKRTAIESEIAELYLRITEARERITQARLVATTAKRTAALAQTAYANGAATQLSVSQAMDRLDQTRIGAQNALYEYRAAYYDWELLTGQQNGG